MLLCDCLVASTCLSLIRHALNILHVLEENKNFSNYYHNENNNNNILNFICNLTFPTQNATQNALPVGALHKKT